MSAFAMDAEGSVGSTGTGAVDAVNAVDAAVPGALLTVTAEGELVFAETATPTDSGTTTQPGTPTMRPDLEVTDVSPGLEGFLAIFAVAVVAIFLMLSMTKKLRKVNHSAGADNQASAVFSDRAAPQERTAERSSAGTSSAGTSAPETSGSEAPAAPAQEGPDTSDGPTPSTPTPSST